MNAISSAAPCHVLHTSGRYDVVLWTLDEQGGPCPWIVVAGMLDKPWRRWRGETVSLMPGPALKAGE